MKFTIFGTTTCANCKAVKMMATARGIAPSYVLIDEHADLKASYDLLVSTVYGENARVALPLVHVESAVTGQLYQGIQGGQQAIRDYLAQKN